MTDTTCQPCNINPIENVGDCATPTPTVTTDAACVTGPSGKSCPPVSNCVTWDLTQGPEDCLIAEYIQEQLNISGAVLNIYKLLGVHEQGLLQDVTGAGTPISSGALGNNPASNAFDKYITEWKSLQTGSTVIQSGYLGYDFGPIRMSNGRERYGLPTETMRDISTLKIMQGCDSKNRVTKMRIERSENGVKWFGVQIVNVKDCDGIVEINFKRSVPSRYWRIRPINFNGTDGDSWIVRVLQFMEYEATAQGNIQDKILLENRDRDYSELPVTIKAAYTPQEYSSQFDRWGANQLGDIFNFDVSFAQCVQRLGRPIVIGDILMVPSERQYTAALVAIDKYLEVTDVLWSSSGFSHTWTPSVQKIIAKPLLASQETQQIVGKLTNDVDSSGLFDINDGGDDKKYQDYMDVSDTIRAGHKAKVPANGIDYANVPVLSHELRAYAKANPNMDLNDLSRARLPTGIDAMPPNGLPYTEGDDFPATAVNNAYHRLSYNRVGANLPVRLYRYSSAKGRWLYLETDRKAFITANRPLLAQYTGQNSSKTPLDDIDS